MYRTHVWETLFGALNWQRTHTCTHNWTYTIMNNLYNIQEDHTKASWSRNRTGTSRSWSRQRPTRREDKFWIRDIIWNFHCELAFFVHGNRWWRETSVIILVKKRRKKRRERNRRRGGRRGACSREGKDKGREKEWEWKLECFSEGSKNSCYTRGKVSSRKKQMELGIAKKDGNKLLMYHIVAYLLFFGVHIHVPLDTKVI